MTSRVTLPSNLIFIHFFFSIYLTFNFSPSLFLPVTLSVAITGGGSGGLPGRGSTPLQGIAVAALPSSSVPLLRIAPEIPSTSFGRVANLESRAGAMVATAAQALLASPLAR